MHRCRWGDVAARIGPRGGSVSSQLTSQIKFRKSRMMWMNIFSFALAVIVHLLHAVPVGSISPEVLAPALGVFAFSLFAITVSNLLLCLKASNLRASKSSYPLALKFIHVCGFLGLVCAWWFFILTSVPLADFLLRFW